ncbi:MAG TPA: hypothetical protein VGK48_21290 [Terriglobia bacterium]|jgi:chromosome segregation ATPase
MKILSLALLFLIFALDCSAQSVADAARQERERQKSLRSTVTFTGVAASTAVTTSGTAPSTAVRPFELKDNNGHDEKYWRNRFDEARAELKRAQDRIQVLDAKVKDLNTEYLTRSDIYDREDRLRPQITENQRQLDEARKDVEKGNQKISDLEDELRKAGGPAGWAR